LRLAAQIPAAAAEQKAGCPRLLLLLLLLLAAGDVDKNKNKRAPPFIAHWHLLVSTNTANIYPRSSQYHALQ
jgi:hypothetical protein